MDISEFLNRRKATGLPTVEEVLGWLPPAVESPRRIALFSDIHANWSALTAALEHARGRYDTVWFLGDIVGYGPYPVECARFAQALNQTQLCVGNHDLGVADEVLLKKHLEGHKAGKNVRWTWVRHRQQLQEDSAELWQWFVETMSDGRIQPAHRRWGPYHLELVHAIPDDPVGFSLYPNDWANLLVNLREVEQQAGSNPAAAWLITGHTHMVCLARLDDGPKTMPKLLPITYDQPVDIRTGTYWINPGSIGQPRDGDWRTAYAILDVVAGQVTFYRTEYDKRTTQREMLQEDYPREFVERLGDGRIKDTKHFEAAYSRTETGLLPCAPGQE
jgi:predicted phosphodiesterase